MDICLAFGDKMGQEHQHTPSCSKTTDPDMALGDITDPDITMASSGHCDVINVASIGSIAHGHQHDFKLSMYKGHLYALWW